MTLSSIKNLGYNQDFFYYMREQIKQLYAQGNSTQNIYHACIQKTGSQWIRKVFKDIRVQKYTGLLCYPQHRYEMGEFKKSFPKYTFVGGLYLPYELYDEIVKPKSYRTFYVLRDPRNVIISWYYSMLETHKLMGRVDKHRRKLKKMGFEDGISYCIRAQQLKFSFVKSWIFNNDQDVLIVRFEDLVNNPLKGFKEIFNHCEVDIPEAELSIILNDYRKSKMREKDLEKNKREESHYRTLKTDWKEVFTRKHEAIFQEVNGDLVKILGYD